MKKLLLIMSLTALTYVTAHARGNNTHAPTTQSIPTPFGRDVIIHDDTLYQKAVKIATAYNGWQFAAISFVDSANNAGGIYVEKSADNGSTWTTITNFSNLDTRYNAFDIAVGGKDTVNLTVFLAVVSSTLSIPHFTAFVNSYKGTTGAYINQSFHKDNLSRTIYDIAIATDDTFPALDASPFTVGVLFSMYSSSYDSIAYTYSNDGGLSYPAYQTVAITTNYFRKVSLAYGRSSNASFGRYFAAWEKVGSPIYPNGNIYEARTLGGADGGWTPPVDIDSLGGIGGLVRNPHIAASITANNNDSLDITALVVLERDYAGLGSDIDILGLYNKTAAVTNVWNVLAVNNSTDMDYSPDVAFSQGDASFKVTYFDSARNYMPVLINDFNLQGANTWDSLTTHYNDSTTNNRDPLPQIAINKASNAVNVAWIRNRGTKGSAMFDSENSTVSVISYEQAHGGLLVYPNPAAHDINVSVSLNSPSRVTVSVFNALGQALLTKDLGTLEQGTTNTLINVGNLKAGNYFVRITGERFVDTKQISITNN